MKMVYLEINFTINFFKLFEIIKMNEIWRFILLVNLRFF